MRHLATIAMAVALTGCGQNETTTITVDTSLLEPVTLTEYNQAISDLAECINTRNLDGIKAEIEPNPNGPDQLAILVIEDELLGRSTEADATYDECSEPLASILDNYIG